LSERPSRNVRLRNAGESIPGGTIAMKTTFLRRVAALWCLLIVMALADVASAREGKVVREALHVKSIEANVTGESIERRVSVYLPPSYEIAPNNRYPTVYLLHGIGDDDRNWTESWSESESADDGYATIQDVMDRGVREGRFGEMIIVMPDQRTKSGGSFYVNSKATGNWEDYTSKELVEHIDEKYRTLPYAASRAIAGHSMGGFGAITLAMKNPDVFSVVYAMNPALLRWSRDLSIENEDFVYSLQARSLDELFRTDSVFAIALITISQAISPNLRRPPFYADLPFKLDNGSLAPAEPAFTKWQEYSPANLVERHEGNLRKLTGIKIDSGNRDEFLFIIDNSRDLSRELSAYGIDHVFEEYNGDHRNRLWGHNGRLISDVLPFVWFNVRKQ
jgi:S-formylglutathione hydrolase FrmB